MNSGQDEGAHEDEEAGQYIHEDDVLEEIGDDGDHPMDDEDETENTVEGAAPLGDHEISDIVWEDKSISHFPNHGVSVFAVATHPSEPIAASGGEDDLGYIWDLAHGEVVATLTGHTDSVASVEFSSDGEM